LYRFPHIARYWSKIAKFIYHTCRGWQCRDLAKMFSIGKIRTIGLPHAEESMMVCAVSMKDRIATDRQTDKIAMSLSHTFIGSVVLWAIVGLSTSILTGYCIVI